MIDVKTVITIAVNIYEQSSACEGTLLRFFLHIIRY